MSPQRSAREELGTLQRWMLSVITDPRGIAAGIASAEAQREIQASPGELEQIITRSQNLTSAERLNIYANAYHARLIECLQAEFPAMAYVLGEETFNGFALEYLQSYPPRSYTLATLGAHFPQFLRETRPPAEQGDADSPNWPDFLIDLATLERTYSEVFDGPGIEGRRGLRLEDLSGIPPERWPDAKLVPAACLRLLALHYPVHEVASGIKRGENPTLPAPSPTFLVVTRRDYLVRPRAVSRAEYQMLESLCKGDTVGEVVSAAAEAAEMPVSQLAGQLRDWFERWSADNLFCEIVTED